ncbi:MAG TPA: MMPL family transporter, partial [Thermomicrobiales bacterium]|nr:MMPL family transporter [Thermomicrobiales bacterium]
YQDDFTTPIESQTGQHLIEQHFGTDTNASEMIIFRSEHQTVDDPAFKQVVDGAVANLAPFQDDIAGIVNYYDAPDSPDMQALVGDDGHALLMPVAFSKEPADLMDRYKDYDAAIEASRAEGFDVYSAGDVSANEIGDMVNEDLSKDITVGLPVAAIVLIVVFGALIAAGVPLVLGVITILTATGLAQIIGGRMVIDDSGMMLVTMIGLAVGIDYSLFLLERYREERRNGAQKQDAIERAGATAGKAVIFSGGTVLLALLGLLLLPITIFRGMGLATAATVVVAVLASMTLLPALVSLLGDWINFPRFGLNRKLRRQDETGISQFEAEKPGHGAWGHLAAGVMKKPLLSAMLAGGFLLLCASPILTMKLGQPSTASLPDSDVKTGWMMIAQYYDAGLEEPVRIVIPGDAESTQDKATALTDAVATDARFGQVTSQTSPDNAITVVNVALHIDPFSVEGEQAVRHLRNDVVPQVFDGQTSEIYVTGSPAMVMDFNSTLSDRLPVVFAFVLGLSFILLMVAFRSVVIPVISIALNLLSVGAAYGAVVAVFQHGWFADALGLTEIDSIVNWLPVMLFCILFGLSMDYHVFLLSRIREHWDHTADNEASIVAGLQSTGRIITGAALIMVAVFSSFAMGRLSEVQQMGFGLGVAVLLDATLIRTVLVPAIMRLAGNANWAFPRGLRWLPNINVEGNLDPIELAPHQGSAD